MFLQKKLLVRYVFVLVISTLAFIILWREMATPILNVSHPQINIILLETKIGKLNLSLREVCAIESAAFHHPDARITLYNINGRADESDENTRNIASHYSTIHFQSLNLSDLFLDTPLEKWSKEKGISHSQFPVEHTSDAARLALLWKHGGLYMDTDAIITKPFYEFQNAVGTIFMFNFMFAAGNGVLMFQKNSTFIHKAMELFQAIQIVFGFIYVSQGPVLMTYLLTVWCDVYWLSDIINKPELCQNILVLPEKAFYPVFYLETNKLFGKGSYNSVDISQSYSVHLYGSQSRDILAKMGDGTAVEMLFQAHCPYTYQLMLKKTYV